MATQKQINQIISDSSHALWLIRLRGIVSMAEVAAYWTISKARVRRALESLETRGVAFYAYDVNGWKLTKEASLHEPKLLARGVQ
jgi:predicted ArsR family transcriptional regulator